MCANRVQQWYVTIPSLHQWWTPSKPIKTNGCLNLTPSKNHWIQLLPQIIPFSGDGAFENHWNIAMIAQFGPNNLFHYYSITINCQFQTVDIRSRQRWPYQWLQFSLCLVAFVLFCGPMWLVLTWTDKNRPIAIPLKRRVQKNGEKCGLLPNLPRTPSPGLVFFP